MEGTDLVPATLFLRPFADVPIPLRGIHQDEVDRVSGLADCFAPRLIKLLLVPYPFKVDPFVHVPDGVADEAYRQDDEGRPVSTRLIPWPLRYQRLRRVEDDFLGDEAMEEIFVELRVVFGPPVGQDLRVFDEVLLRPKVNPVGVVFPYPEVFRQIRLCEFLVFRVLQEEFLLLSGC